jgi:hypothetical protein
MLHTIFLRACLLPMTSTVRFLNAGKGIGLEISLPNATSPQFSREYIQLNDSTTAGMAETRAAFSG